MDWYDYQKRFVWNLDLSPYYDKPMYEDIASLKEVIPYERKEVIFESAKISLYANKVIAECDGKREEFSFDEASSLAVLGKNKLNIYIGKRVFQVKGSKRFNALKYVNIYYKYQNVLKGDKNGKSDSDSNGECGFLGL